MSASDPTIGLPAGPATDPATDPAGQVACAACATAADGPPPTWSSQSGARGTSWLCPRCTRENLRSIEGRLDEAWW